MWIELIGTGAAGAISVATAVFYSYKVRVAQQEAEEKEKIIEVFEAMRTGDTQSRYIQETFAAMCEIFRIDADAARREIEVYVERNIPFKSYGRSNQRKIEHQIMLGVIYTLDRWLLQIVQHLGSYEKEVIDMKIRQAFYPMETWEAVTAEYDESPAVTKKLLNGFVVEKSRMYKNMDYQMRNILEQETGQREMLDAALTSDHDYLREEMDRLNAAKQLEQEMLIEFTTLINHIEAEVEAERLRFEVEGLKMDEWNIGYAEVIEKAATMRGIPFEAKTKHDYEFLYNLDGMSYEAAVIRIGIGAFFVKFGLNTPEAMKKLIAEPVPQHVEFKDFLAFYGHALYEKPALPEPEVEDVTDEEIEELREEQFEWSKDPSHIIGLDAKTDEEVLAQIQEEFEDDLRISGVKDWQHYLMGYMNTRMLHDAMNTNAASVQDTHMYEKAMNDVQQLRMRMVMFRIQIERMTGVKLESYEWDLRGDMIRDLINERIKAIENSPARQRHAKGRVWIDKLERHRKNERKSMRMRIDGMEPQVIAERKQALAFARHDLVAIEASLAPLLYKQQGDIRALLTEDLRQLNERLLLEELDTEAKRKKALEPPKDEWYPLDERLKASRAKRTEITEFFDRMRASQRDFDTSSNHLAFLQFAKRSEKALIKYVKLVTEVYKTANRTKHDAVAEVFVEKIAEAQKDYLVAAGNLHVFIKEHEIHFEWTNNVPRQVRMLIGRAIKSMKGDGTTGLETFLEAEANYMHVVEPASNEEAIFVDVKRLKTLYKEVLGDDLEEVARHGAVTQVTHTIEGNFVMIPKEDDTKISFDDMTILLIRVMTYERDVTTVADALLLLLHWKRDEEYFEKVAHVIQKSEPNDEEAVWAQAIRFYVHGLTGTHTLRLQHVMLIEEEMRKAGYSPRLKTIGYLRGTLDKLEEHKKRQAFFEATYRFLVAAPETRYKYVLEQYAYAYFVSLYHCWEEDMMNAFATGLIANPKDRSLFASLMVGLSKPHAVNPAVLPASVAEHSRFETYAVDVDGNRLRETLEHLQDIYDSYAKAGKQAIAQELRNLLEDYVGIRVQETDDIQLTFEQLLQATYRINERGPASAIHFFALVLPRLKEEVMRLTKD